MLFLNILQHNIYKFIYIYIYVFVYMEKMSRIVLQNVNINKVSLFNLLRHLNTAKNQNLKYKSSKLGHTSVLIQEGNEIRELPLIVRNVCGNDICTDSDCTSEINSNTMNLIDKLKDFNSESDRKKAEEEIVDVIRGFKKCSSVKSLIDLLEIVMLDEITPAVALCALKKIVELENFKFHVATYRVSSFLETRTNIDYTKTTILHKLLQIISNGDDQNSVVEALELIPLDQVKVLPSDVYKNILSQEILCRVTESKLNINELCRSIDTFSKLNDFKKADQLWVGIMDKNSQIDESNIITVFRIMYLLKKSRKTIMNMLERRFQDFWHKLNVDELIEIIYTMKLTKCVSIKILEIISRWINTNIHTISETNLTSIVIELNQIGYVDIGIVKALERYVKAKHNAIKNPSLLVEIMKYSSKFNIQSEKIFDGCAKYLVNFNQQLNPSQIRDIFWPFGQLNYKPKCPINFWKTIENIMNKEFFNFKSHETLDMLIACVFLEKHPLNFIHRVFNPSFLQQLYDEGGQIDHTKMKLKLIDQCMTLECKHFQGPVLPRDKSAKSIWIDFRIKKVIKYVSNNIEHVFKDFNISYSIFLSQLPIMSIYFIDALVHPKNSEINYKYINFKEYPGLCSAIIIHLPEHYCWESENLIGMEETRIRHFRKIGLNVITMNYNKLNELKYPAEITEYIFDRYKNMLGPL
ncbi:FAST kinase domain-containing protein 3, mitochondrial-like [Daktulosphaira vitifoliae]|uniref:FAST kinase domain-containing protein 3, mitochondrial-like n=1 Tax=Daktulosphaira vitifoliae TaxID=58002 RepID=UPI0021AA08CD|nr:FAST kinase domain-containing protein 3, mitochondrial-like [Daktulosphaira vitifoliae]